MKLIIQIPAFNEEATLGLTLSKLPKTIPGISKVEWMVIDDGSTDNTVQVAKQHNVDHIVSLTKNQGLAKVFMTGIETCLEKGADIIVNTDADNQYNADDIPKLIDPIIKGNLDIVIGARPIKSIPHFSFLKKCLQQLGSFMMNWISNTNIPDAPSGFRAISRNAALQLNIFNNYTYTLEMIIQAGKKNLAIGSVPITVNKDERPSKLVKSIPQYIKRSIVTMLRIFNTYKPLQFFTTIGSISIFLGILCGIRWVILFMGKGQAQHLPSLILTAILILIGTQLFIVGLFGDLISVNRKLLEDIQLKIRKQSLNNQKNNS